MQGTVNNGSSGIKVFHLAETINTTNPFGINNAYHLSYIDAFNVELMDKDGNKKVFNYKTKTWADSTSDDTKENLALTKWGDYYYKVVTTGIEKYDKELKLVKNVPFQNGITMYSYSAWIKIEGEYAYNAFMARNNSTYFVVFDKDLNIISQIKIYSSHNNKEYNIMIGDIVINYNVSYNKFSTYNLNGTILNSLSLSKCKIISRFRRKSILISCDAAIYEMSVTDDGILSCSSKITNTLCKNVNKVNYGSVVAFDINDYYFDTITEHNSEIVHIRQKIKTKDANSIYCNSANFNRVVICRYSTSNSNLIFEVYNRK